MSGNNYNREPLIEAQKLPEDYVMQAEKFVREHNYRGFTTTKLRRLLSLLLDIYNEENLSKEPELSEKSKKKLQLALMRMYYEGGREPNAVKPFLKDSNIISYLKGVGNRKEFLDVFHYMESLVAFHRYYNGDK